MPAKHGFLRLVKERHDPTLTRKHVCPYCGSESVDNKGGIMTAVGGPVNHYTNHCLCRACGKGFMHEWKENGKHWKTGEVQDVHWYSDPVTRKVLKGIPGCCGHSVWTCKHCGCDVIVTPLDRSGIYLAGEQERDRYQFTCEGCERSAKSIENTYALPDKPGPKPKPDPNRKPLMIYEVTGMGIINPGALERLK